MRADQKDLEYQWQVRDFIPFGRWLKKQLAKNHQVLPTAILNLTEHQFQDHLNAGWPDIDVRQAGKICRELGVSASELYEALTGGNAKEGLIVPPLLQPLGLGGAVITEADLLLLAKFTEWETYDRVGSQEINDWLAELVTELACNCGLKGEQRVFGGDDIQLFTTSSDLYKAHLAGSPYNKNGVVRSLKTGEGLPWWEIATYTAVARLECKLSVSETAKKIDRSKNFVASLESTGKPKISLFDILKLDVATREEGQLLWLYMFSNDAPQFRQMYQHQAIVTFLTLKRWFEHTDHWQRVAEKLEVAKFFEKLWQDTQAIKVEGAILLGHVLLRL